MTLENLTPSSTDDKYLRLLWLYRLRWGAIAGQIAIFLVAYFALQLSISPQSFLVILCLTIISNYILGKCLQNENISREILAASAILADVFLLSALLYFYGGHTNPFSMMYLTLVVLAALFLGGAWSFAVLLISGGFFLTLSFYYVPVPELALHHHGEETFSLHLQGMLLAFFLLGALISYFVARLNLDLKKNEAALKVLQLKASQEAKLAALTTLAAGAAHELSTPLGTIAIIAHELNRACSQGLPQDDLASDIKTIQQEVQRCEAILQGMGIKSGEILGEMPGLTTPQAVIDTLCTKLNSDYLARLKIALPSPKTTFTVPLTALVTSLFSLVKNAFDASNPNELVSLEIAPKLDQISFIISDNGCGISKDNLGRVGEPFFTTKQAGAGLGLGVFLVKLFAQRFGGILSYSIKEQGGTIASLTIPRVEASHVTI